MNPDPALYSLNCGAQISYASYLLDNVKLFNTSYPNVVDIGCGTGEVTNIVCDRLPGVKRIVAYDKVEGMVDFAQKHNPDPRIKYVVADAEKPNTMRPEWTGLFNMVTSFTALHWVMDQALAVRQISKILAPGGEFMLLLAQKAPPSFLAIGPKITKYPRWNKYLKDFVPPWYHTPGWEKHQQWRKHPVDGYTGFCRGAGLNVKDIEVIELDYTFPNEDRCKGMIETVLPHTLAIPKPDLPDFMIDALAIFKETCPRTKDGKLRWIAAFLWVHGWKPSGE